MQPRWAAGVIFQWAAVRWYINDGAAWRRLSEGELSDREEMLIYMTKIPPQLTDDMEMKSGASKITTAH